MAVYTHGRWIYSVASHKNIEMCGYASYPSAANTTCVEPYTFKTSVYEKLGSLKRVVKKNALKIWIA